MPAPPVQYAQWQRARAAVGEGAEVRALLDQGAAERVAADRAAAAPQGESAQAAPIAAVGDAGIVDQTRKKKGQRRKSAGAKQGKENGASTGEEKKKAQKWSQEEYLTLTRAWKKATETPSGASNKSSQYWDNVAGYCRQLTPDGSWRRDGTSRACAGFGGSGRRCRMCEAINTAAGVPYKILSARLFCRESVPDCLEKHPNRPVGVRLSSPAHRTG